MQAKIIIGSNYGDEGKGTVTASCTLHSTGKVLNVLTNGGSQRGHSIIRSNGDSITYKHFGSGTLEGADNYFYKTFILNPMQFCIEYNNLNKKFNVFCSDKCRFTTPFDSMANLIMEKRRGDSKHGSCGMGIWNTVKRYACYKDSKSFYDFYNMNSIDKLKYLNSIKTYYDNMLGEIDSYLKDAWNSDILLYNFIKDSLHMGNTIKFISDEEAKIIFKKDYTDIIFENGQGLLLTDTGKDILGTTPSDTTSLYAIEAIKSIFSDVDSVEYRYITRPYLNKHGNGEMQNECTNIKLLSSYLNEDRTNHFNMFQGKFRYGILDINSLKERIYNDYNSTSGLVNNPILSIDVTHCDEIDRMSEFKKEFTGNNIYTYSSPKII